MTRDYSALTWLDGCAILAVPSAKAHIPMRHFAALVLLAASCAAAIAAPVRPPEAEAMLQRISADSLRGHLSFLASDLLEGRGTPSKGQDIAAEYIAAQFRRAGLQPMGDDGYFQTASYMYAERDLRHFILKVEAGGKQVTVPAAQVSFSYKHGHRVDGAVPVRMEVAAAVAAPAEVAGKVLVVPVPAGTHPFMLVGQLYKANVAPAAILLLDANRAPGLDSGAGWLVDAANPPKAGAVQRPPVIVVHAPEAIAAFNAGAAKVDLVIPGATERPIKLRNVVAKLTGSDPALKETYVILSAHYDHVGMQGGEVFNGANDDASGTVAMIDIAHAMATLPVKPKRSILFIALYGEELGMVGSKYYGAHPVVPINKTVAMINLEQVGRTDDTEGPQINRASLTGFDYSSVGTSLQAAGKELGIAVVKHPKASDDYFSRSDNQSLADQGVPAHTLSVAYSFPDYHGKDDHWDKIDYANMANISKMVALATYRMAQDPKAPAWDPAVEKAKKYFNAFQQRQGVK